MQLGLCDVSVVRRSMETTAVVALVAGPLTAVVGWMLNRVRDRGEQRQKILFQLYERQVHLFEEFDRRSTEAYHGSLDPTVIEKRRIDFLAFRVGVLFAFADEHLADEAMGALFAMENANERMRRDVASLADTRAAIDDVDSASERFATCCAKMISTIQKLERKLGVPPIRVTPRTAKRLQDVAADEQKRVSSKKRAPRGLGGALLVRERHQVAAVEVEQVEDHERAEAPPPSRRPCNAPKSGSPRSSRRRGSPVPPESSA